MPLLWRKPEYWALRLPQMRFWACLDRVMAFDYHQHQTLHLLQVLIVYREGEKHQWFLMKLMGQLSVCKLRANEFTPVLYLGMFSDIF